MNSNLLILLLILGLGFSLFKAATAKKLKIRLLFSSIAFLSILLIWNLAVFVVSLDHNSHYNSAAKEMINIVIDRFEHQDNEVILEELKLINAEVSLTYESKGNFKELTESLRDKLQNGVPTSR